MYEAQLSGIRAICFDLFHTLVDVGQVPDSVGGYTADILGFDRDVWNRCCFSDVHDIRRPTSHVDVIRTLARQIDPGISEQRVRQAAAERQRRFDHALTRVDGETLAVLLELRARGLRLALISNASTGEVSAWPDSPLATCFDAAVFSCECGHAKPEPAIYALAARRLGVQRQHCLFVGDGGSDEHAGARAAGMHPVLLTRFVGPRLAPEVLDARRREAIWEVRGVGELLGLLPG
ncbi:MAG: HAD-IA family hydrolase [Gammaproteobacteria bacterium]